MRTFLKGLQASVTILTAEHSTLTWTWSEVDACLISPIGSGLRLVFLGDWACDGIQVIATVKPPNSFVLWNQDNLANDTFVFPGTKHTDHKQTNMHDLIMSV